MLGPAAAGSSIRCDVFFFEKKVERGVSSHETHRFESQDDVSTLVLIDGRSDFGGELIAGQYSNN